VRALSRKRALAGVPLVLSACAGLGLAASCGARTGLPEEEVADAAAERGFLSPDRFFVEEPKEEPKEEDALPDVLPFIDANRPDGPPLQVNPCPDSGATLIYVMSKTNVLYSFDPASASFTKIGTIACPGSQGTPFSMAVDREGVAYVIFSNNLEGSGEQVGTGLFRVSTKTADCTATTYDAGGNGGYTFGMGFVAGVSDGGDAGEQLFVSLDVSGITGDGVLSTLDTTTFELTTIAKFVPSVDAAELTGTGDGRLFAFSPSMADGGSFLAQVDPATAKVIGQDPLPGIVQGEGWAFGFWGGNFYTFTTAGTASGPTDMMTVVHEFNPATMTVTPITTLDDTIVGAGVSTCAPQG
jgi:hypothetical protein